MKNSIIEIKDLSASYNGKTVLDNINLSIYKDDYLGIIGPNGGGKTTLIKCIMGLKEKDSGSIKFFKEGKEVPFLRIGYLPQYTLIDKNFPISVIEVILSGLSCTKRTCFKYTTEDKDRAKSIAQRMGLSGLESRPIGELSGGQLQRTLLGRSLIARPHVLILDEPSTYIDKKFEAELYLLLKEIQKECAIILVSHDIATTLSQTQNIACVNKTLHYHTSADVSGEWLEEQFGCSISILGFNSLIK